MEENLNFKNILQKKSHSIQIAIFFTEVCVVMRSFNWKVKTFYVMGTFSRRASWCRQGRYKGGVTRDPGGVLPDKGLMGTCRQPGYVFRDFCLKQGIFSWTINSLRDSVNQAVNRFVIANGLNKKEFRYLLLSYTGYQKSEFCLKQGRKISDFCLRRGQGVRGRAAPPYPRIYRVPPPSSPPPGEMTPFQSVIMSKTSPPR